MKTRNPRTAFTLVELLVVVAIIAIVVSGIVAVGGYVRTSAQVKNTQSVIAALAAALEEYKIYYAAAERAGGTFEFPPSPNNPANPADVETSIITLYANLDKIPACRAILERLPADHVVVNPGGFTVVIDAWKTPLYYENLGGGNFPIIYSAGLDKLFGTADDIISTDL